MQFSVSRSSYVYVLSFSTSVRFRMQVMLNGRLFPVAEASSKKVAKKDAAAATLRVLIGEMQGGTGTVDEGNAASVDQVVEALPDTSVSCYLLYENNPFCIFSGWPNTC